MRKCSECMAGTSASQFHGSAFGGKSSKCYLTLLHMAIHGGTDGVAEAYLPPCVFAFCSLSAHLGVAPCCPPHLSRLGAVSSCVRLRKCAARRVKSSLEDLEGAGGDWTGGDSQRRWCSCCLPALISALVSPRPTPFSQARSLDISLCPHLHPQGFGIWAVPCLERGLFWQYLSKLQMQKRSVPAGPLPNNNPTDKLGLVGPYLSTRLSFATLFAKERG